MNRGPQCTTQDH